MNKQNLPDEAIQSLLESATDKAHLARLERKLDFLLSTIVIRQKDACDAAQIHTNTIRNRSVKNQIETFQADGSRMVYLTLKETHGLKMRSRNLKSPNGAKVHSDNNENLVELFFAVQYKEIGFREFERRIKELFL